MAYHIYMRKRLIPFAYATNVFEVSDDFFKKLGIKTILFDLDNTLDPYTVSLPSQRSQDFVKRMKDLGITTIVTSNNRGGRVNTYCKALGIECVCLMAKPFSFKIKRLLKERGFELDKTILIGDQIMTDVKAGNGAHIKVMLTEPLDTEHEPFTTVINRIFDRPVRKKLMKKGYLRSWRELL